MTTFIYGLADPDDETVRYVGKSNHPKKRIMNHTSPKNLLKNSHKNHWLNGLLRQGKYPLLVILEEVDISCWEEAEKSWIIKLAKNNLTNVAPGGSGAQSMSEENKSAMSRRNTGNKNACGKRSDITRRNISKGRTGIKISEEGSRKLSEAKRGKMPKTDSHRESIRNTLSQRWTAISPSGEIHDVVNLKLFCAIHNIRYPNLSSRGKANGWSCTRFKDNINNGK